MLTYKDKQETERKLELGADGSDKHTWLVVLLAIIALGLVGVALIHAITIFKQSL